MHEQTYSAGADGCQCQPNPFAKADALLAEVGELVTLGSHDATTKAFRTCELILRLLSGVRIPLRRLAGVGQEGTQ